jgi:hypothetical protein
MLLCEVDEESVEVEWEEEEKTHLNILMFEIVRSL